MILDRTDPELVWAWGHFADPEMVDAASGECLQYMGTAQQPDGSWSHCFRHRSLPGTGARRYWHIPARQGWRPPRLVDAYDQKRAAERPAREQLHQRYREVLDWLERNFHSLSHWRRFVEHAEALIQTFREEEPLTNPSAASAFMYELRRNYGPFDDQA
jgi:hypothetical protein